MLEHRYEVFQLGKVLIFNNDALNFLRIPYTTTIVSVSPAANAFMYARIRSLVR